MKTHPALGIDYDTLISGLQNEVDLGFVNKNRHKTLPLDIYSYTGNAMIDSRWNEFTCIARGLVVDYENKKIVATPFPKFFNVNEGGRKLPNLPCRFFEKVDGSLGIVFNYKGEWICSTRGSFVSWQSEFAKQCILPVENHLDKNCTYLAEIVSLDNRVVIRYDFQGLVLLGGYNKGVEMPFDEIKDLSNKTGLKIAKEFKYPDPQQAIAAAIKLGADAEGYVLCFDNGERHKIKGDLYKIAHKNQEKITPLGVWEFLEAGADLNEVKKNIPDEFLNDFDALADFYKTKLSGLVNDVKALYEPFKNKPDVELRDFLKTCDHPLKNYVYQLKKFETDFENRARSGLCKTFRPNGERYPKEVLEKLGLAMPTSGCQEQINNESTQSKILG